MYPNNWTNIHPIIIIQLLQNFLKRPSVTFQGIVNGKNNNCLNILRTWASPRYWRYYYLRVFWDRRTTYAWSNATAWERRRYTPCRAPSLFVGYKSVYLWGGLDVGLICHSLNNPFVLNNTLFIADILVLCLFFGIFYRMIIKTVFVVFFFYNSYLPP